VSAQTKHALGALPFRLDVRATGGHLAGPRLILVHGTPVLNTVYWTADRPDSFCTEMAVAAGARAGDVIACGHTHIPWQRAVEGVSFINTGSVGRPKDGDWRACYAIVDFARDRTTAVEFVRVEYDVERAAAAIVAGGLPPEFAEYLRSGGARTS
jgi:diadenosine tetraphosphatase ApaH/serine/threonine PP2A family protein phosphatase